MSIKTIYKQVRTLLETEDLFKQKVTNWDYSILDTAVPRAVILKPGRVDQAIDAYGNQWLRRVRVIAEVHTFYEPSRSTASVDRLLDAIDIIDTLLIDNYHLGLTVDVIRQAIIESVSDVALVDRGVGQNKWFRAIITIAADEPEAGGAGAQ